MLPRTMARAVGRNFKNKTALICGETRATFGELDARSDRLAAVFATLGIAKGDTAAILSPERIEVHEHFWTCMKTGVVRVGVNTRYAWPEIEYVLTDSAARILFVEHRSLPLVADHVDRLKDLGITLVGIGTDAFGLEYEGLLAEADAAPTLPEIADDDTLFVSYTSGTTGFPKGVAMTHAGVADALAHSVTMFGFSTDDVWYNPSASAWVTVLMTQFNLANGMTSVIPDGAFRIDGFLADVERFRVTSVILVPTMIQWILRELKTSSYDLSSWRLLVYGSAPSSPALIRDIRKNLKVDLLQTYGLTEASGGWVTYLTEADHRLGLTTRPELLGSVGRAGVHFELSIRDDAGNPVPPDTRGELWVRGRANMKAYLNKPAETAEVMRPDGWMRTNDIARMDADGYLFLLDRQKFMIITGAVNVFPATVEAIVCEHPAVAEVAVVGAPHPDWGEAVVAFVRPRETAEAVSIEDLTTFCAAHLSKPEVPKHFIFVEDLPRTSNQKVMKQPLKQLLVDDPSLLPWSRAQ